MSPKRFLREPDVKEITGLSRTTRWRLERAGSFPHRRQISPNLIAWDADEIYEWVESRSVVENSDNSREMRPAV